ncbi:unnamed protein product [Symbiodinium sp. CCMP2592]|nr:unnamed protein product [Symbiodinium sp. CCMP2592]
MFSEALSQDELRELRAAAHALVFFLAWKLLAGDGVKRIPRDVLALAAEDFMHHLDNRPQMSMQDKSQIQAVEVQEQSQMSRRSDEDQLSDDSIRTSYVSHQRTGEENEVDEDGLPLVYNSALINSYWGKNAGAVTGRWSDFLGVATPWIASAFSAAMTGRWSEEERSLAKDAVKSMQTLGPTFIKLGQVLSIRPDVLSPVVMEELSSLQDDIAAWHQARTGAAWLFCFSV